MAELTVFCCGSCPCDISRKFGFMLREGLYSKLTVNWSKMGSVPTRKLPVFQPEHMTVCLTRVHSVD